jgi:hypothetical protein
VEFQRIKWEELLDSYNYVSAVPLLDRIIHSIIGEPCSGGAADGDAYIVIYGSKLVVCQI